MNRSHLNNPIYTYTHINANSFLLENLNFAEADRLAGAHLCRLRPDPAPCDAYVAAVAVGSAGLEAQLAWEDQGTADGPTRFDCQRVRFQTRRRP